MFKNINELAKAYKAKSISPVELTKSYLDKIEVGSIYRLITAQRAMAQAKQAESLFNKGIVLGPLQGVPIAIKDLVDTKADVTAAGSKVLANNSPALEDSPVAARLDAAGAIFLGKTNMTELAFSGLGLNPHFGTPGSAVDSSLIPGGSSAGSGVAVATDLAMAAIGSDTGGSVRIPAAFNAIVGLKTTNGLIPTDGVVPLSTSLDTIGPMTKTVEDAWHIYRVLAAKSVKDFELKARQFKLLVPTNIVFNNIDTAVKEAFDFAISIFEAAGHVIEYKEIPEFVELYDLLNEYGGLASHEALAIYEDLLMANYHDFDPRVAKRILEFKNSPRTSSDYLRLSYKRKELVGRFWQKYGSYNAILSPTVAIMPPKIKTLEESDEAYFKANGLCLRNTMLFNYLSGPAVSVPVKAAMPIGLMIAAAPYQEKAVLEIASLIEAN